MHRRGHEVPSPPRPPRRCGLQLTTLHRAELERGLARKRVVERVPGTRGLSLRRGAGRSVGASAAA
eukprot:37771-Prymnesium_polylepis.1